MMMLVTTMPDLIDTPLGSITVEEVTATRYVVGQKMFDTEAAARAHLRRNSVKVLEEFAATPGWLLRDAALASEQVDKWMTIWRRR